MVFKIRRVGRLISAKRDFWTHIGKKNHHVTISSSGRVLTFAHSFRYLFWSIGRRWERHMKITEMAIDTPHLLLNVNTFLAQHIVYFYAYLYDKLEHTHMTHKHIFKPSSIWELFSIHRQQCGRIWSCFGDETFSLLSLLSLLVFCFQDWGSVGHPK